jgi:hypothetical protein
LATGSPQSPQEVRKDRRPGGIDARIWLAALAALVVLVVALVAADPFGGGSGSPGGPGGSATSPGRQQPAATPTTTVNPQTAPVPPSQGAYFGAWVKPVTYTQPDRIAAVQALQRQIGRRLAIVHTYARWTDPFPTRSDLAFMGQGSTLLLSWGGTDPRAVVAGTYDSWIRQRARAIKATRKRIFLEWLWEMDRPNLRGVVHSPADFIAAWKHIRAIFDSEHVHNVAWVWCPTARGFGSGDAAAFYPGNSQVDWVCADVYPGPGPYRSFADTARAFLDWASRHPGKPVMIGEYGVPQSYSPSQRASWLQAAAQTVRADPQIKALVYFDGDPAGRLPEGRYALTSDASVVQAFRGVSAQPYFNPPGRPAGG